MAIKILADSVCDLPQDIIEEYDIDILPIIIIDSENGKEYLDGVTLKSKDLYVNMRKGKVYKTAQIPMKAFEEKFEEIYKNKQSAIYIAFSSGISATYETSVMTKNLVKERHPDLDISIVDSKAASLGLGLIVYKAAKMAKSGKSKEEILKMLNFYTANIEHVFTVGDLEYLFRGGRVTRSQKFMSGLLSIKPIIDISKDGKLRPIEKVRGKTKVVTRMIEIMEERAKEANLKTQTIGITHGDNKEGAIMLKQMIEEKCGCSEIITSEMGCAIGAHVGPGTVALLFLDKDYD